MLVIEPFDSPALKSYFETHYEGRADAARLKGANYEVVGCRDCGLGYQPTIRGGTLLHDLYEHWIPPSEKERLHRNYDLGDFNYLTEQVQFLIRQLRRDPHSIRVFDFVMEWSEWASMARAFGCEVSGAELSPARVRHVRSMGLEVIDWDDIPHQEFDFNNTEQVFEHSLEPLETLRQSRPGWPREGC